MQCPIQHTEAYLNLVAALGGDHVAARSAKALIRYLDIRTIDDLGEYYTKTGPVVFSQNVIDMRCVGVLSAERITRAAVRAAPVS